MLGQLTEVEIDTLLKNSHIGRIGCCLNGEVYVVPILYAYDGEYIYGHSWEGKKIRMMRQRPEVCFEVDEMQNLANWKSVILQARFEELLGSEQRKAMSLFTDNLQSHLQENMKVSVFGMVNFHQTQSDSLKTVTFRLKIIERTGRFEIQT